jgi:hypothetical protein
MPPIGALYLAPPGEITNPRDLGRALANVAFENERPAKPFRLGSITGRMNKFCELLVGYRHPVEIKRIQFDLSDRSLSIAGIRFGLFGAHQERAAVQENHV